MNKNNLGFLKSFISKNVEPPEKGFVSKFWPREMKIAKELFQKFPDRDFWEKIEIGYKVKSLAWFKMKKGEDFLTLKYKEFHFKPENKQAETLKISDEKFGETIYNSRPPQFAKDFLN